MPDLKGWIDDVKRTPAPRLWDDIEHREPSGGSEHARRPFLAAAILIVTVIVLGSILVVLGSSEDRGALDGTLPREVRVTCRDGEVSVAAPRVVVQTDGVHFSLESDLDAPVLTAFGRTGGQASHALPSGFGGSDRWTWTIDPGTWAFACGSATRSDLPGGAPTVELVDPDGVWHDPSLVCGGAAEAWGRSVSYYTAGNPFPEAVSHVLPGLAEDDEVSVAGYVDVASADRTGMFRIVRRGEVVGTFEVARYDVRTFILPSARFCPSSGIGDPGGTVAGPTVTPFHLPGLARCDPYGRSCVALHMTAEWYQDRSGDTVRFLPPSPTAACKPDQPEGCPPEPEDMIIQVVTTSEDAVRFETDEGCGSEAAPCRAGEA